MSFGLQRIFSSNSVKEAVYAAAGVWHWGPVSVPGQLGSKSNQRQLVTFGRGENRRPALIKSAKARAYESAFMAAILGSGLAPKEPYEGPVVLVAGCHYEDRRRDLDVALLQDCLQRAGIIKNDRQVEEIHAYRYVDKERPRVEFELWARGQGRLMSVYDGIVNQLKVV